MYARMRARTQEANLINIRAILRDVRMVLHKWSKNPTGNVKFERWMWNQMKLVPRDELKALFDKYGVRPPKF
jgi:hypothetical protein